MVLEVIKVPRKDPPPDKPINFPPLENLHLELLENKKKLKRGLPLIPVLNKRIKPKPLPPPENFSGPPPKKEKVNIDELVEDDKPEKASSPKETSNDDDEMIASLGEESDDGVKDIESEGHVSDSERLGDQSDSEVQYNQESEDYAQSEEEPQEEEYDPYAGMSPEEREAAEKEEYIWRWRILKRKYPGKDISSWNEHSDLQLMKKSYNRTLKELQLDDNVESYRTYLIGGFILMEYICTQWLGVDLGGFSTQQIKMMHKYNSLLIELGERPYSTWGSNLPVEIRLLGVIIMQAGMFYLAKVISTKFGSSIGELFKGITGQPPPEQSEPSAKKKKKRMRGPKISADEIREMSRD